MKTIQDMKCETIKDRAFQLVWNQALTENVHLLSLEGDCSAIHDPGQFVSVELPGKYLRRPFSVCDWEADRLTLLVEKVGSGTELLHTLPEGTELNILTGLGRGFHCEPDMVSPLLIGGGSGLSPLVGLYRRLREAGVKPSVLLGFRDVKDRFGKEFFPDAEVRYTDDVFAAMREIPHDAVFACGSQAMMLELCRRDPGPVQVAFDVRMGCGFGACMGCSMMTPHGMKRVCKDGPVFRKEDLI